jgi:CubicO group peptidase (beta-lactamase class C family)
MRHKLAIGLFVSLIVLGATVGQAAIASEAEAYLAPLVASGDFNGVVLIARGETPLFAKAYGSADVELRVPLTMRSRFRIASITKTFTGAAIAMLAERGKLSYDDALSKYLPDFPHGDAIRIRHLLLFESGVGDPDAQTCGDATLDELVTQIASKPLAFEPGTKSWYGNGGFVLLARVIERASGKSWQDFLHDEIFVPLSLPATVVDQQDDVVPDRAHGYVPGAGSTGLANARCAGAWAALGSGALLSTASDLHRWARAVRNERLFKRSTLEYPYGWGVRKYFDRNAIEQSGIINGSASYLAAYLDDDVYVVVLSNVQTGLLTDIGKGLAALTFGAKPPPLTPSPRAQTSTAEERKRWLGHYNNPNIAPIEIMENGKALYLRWGNSPETNYLTPAGASVAYDRQDSIAIELATDGSIHMRWPQGEPQTFTRVLTK